ncbi:aquaporin-4-like [Glandiceps talaboti]
MAEQTLKEQICSVQFWRAVAAEFVATLIFVFLGVASCLASPGLEVSIVQIALCFGLAIATMVQCFGHVSGGHINPAVTLALFCVKKVNILVTIFYILAQCLGSLVGAALVYLLVPDSHHGGFGVTDVSVENWQGLLIEVVITFQLVFTIFATTDGRRRDLGGSASLAIGIAVVIGHLGAVRFTGASMNPARSFGPECFMGKWTNHWVYWLGPILGGILAAFLYEFIFEPSSSVQRLRDTYSPRKTGNVPMDEVEADNKEEDVALKEVNDQNGK